MTDVPPRVGIPRVIEVCSAAVGLIVALPLLVLAAVAIKMSSPGPVLFRQTRVGRGGNRFTMLKLRTMRQNRAGSQVTPRGDERITRVGRVLRKLKLDELPELGNVVGGNLSLVGPRPEVPAYVNLKDPRWQEVLRVRPGLTDPVTLRLRNEEELIAAAGGGPERFYLDILQPYKLEGYIDYLRRRSAWTDLGVLLRSVVAVLLPGSFPAPTVDEVIKGWQ